MNYPWWKEDLCWAALPYRKATAARGVGWGEKPLIDVGWKQVVVGDTLFIEVCIG
jgi:hypothetical protein